jgi:two-component system, OmpR family, sensor kinase
MNLKSIKWRLQLWHGSLLVLLVAGLMTGFYVFERRAKLQAVDAGLQSAMVPLLPKLSPIIGGRRDDGPDPRGGRLPPRLREDDASARFDDGHQDQSRQQNGFRPRPVEGIDLKHYYYASWSPRFDVVALSTNAPPDLLPDKTIPDSEGKALRTVGMNRELSHRPPNGYVVLVGTSLEPVYAELEKLALWLVLIGISITTAGWAMGWWLVVRALEPSGAISRTAEEIARGDLSKRIDSTETESELGQLASVLNSTFARLDAAFEQQRQFTSDAAHELRTPVSVILTQTQSTLNKERTGDEYRETLDACQRAAQRMRRLIESLLQLARLDAGQETMRRIQFDLARTVGENIEMIRPLAHERRITIRAELGDASCQGDPERVSQVITNLLTNALQHNVDGGEVRVQTRTEEGRAVLVVADNGPGIASEHLPNVFRRFYRADAARTASQGRSGLGLAISSAIVNAHGGSIEVESKIGAGSTFIVRLPR